MTAYDAVLLAGFGGPEGPDDVMPFLRNVTRGRGIPEERLVEVSHHYLEFGGISPINDQNRALRSALEAELVRRGKNIPVLWGNRNFTPYFAGTISAAAAEGRLRLLAVATSAYSSYSSCRQYREDFAAALQSAALLGTVTVDKVRPYYDSKGFLDPVLDAVVAATEAARNDGLALDQLEVVFTTHSIPTAMADSSGSAALADHGSGGAYVAQHLSACRTVMSAVSEKVGQVSWQLAYQSRSGPPSMPWLEPDVNDVLVRMAAEGRRGVVVVPIGFVSDHIEVLWDLDREARETAEQHGLWFRRVPTAGTDPRFVRALADLVQERLGSDVQVSRAVDAPPRPDFCAPGCCVNLRGRRPTTAGQDSAADWQDAGVDAAALAASGIHGGLPTADQPVASGSGRSLR